MSPSSRPFSLSHLSVLDVGPPDLITLAADAGFPAVGVRLVSPIPNGIEYPLKPGSPAMKETLRRMDDRGVKVFDIEVVLLTADTEIGKFRQPFEAGAALGAQRVCINIEDPDRSRTIDRFAALCDLAAPYGLALDVEFMVWRPVKTIEDAADVVTRSGKTNGAILVDALHLDRSGGNPAAVAAIAALDPKLLGSVQLCDAPAARPEPAGIIDEARANRCPPGEGELPLRALLAALPAGIPLACEVPMSKSTPTWTPLERAKRIFQATQKLLQS